MPSVKTKVNCILKWFLVFNFLAILITIYLTYLHYEPSASTFCTINEYLNCDIVNKSIYSEIFGIPVAILGLLTYLFLFFIALGVYKDFGFNKWHKWLRPLHLFWLMFIITAVGVAFSLYLTYIELFVLYAVCVFCLAQQIIVIIDLFLLLAILGIINQEKKKHPDRCEFC